MRKSYRWPIQYAHLIFSYRKVWIGIIVLLAIGFIFVSIPSQKCLHKYEMPPYTFADAKCEDELMAMPHYRHRSHLGFGRKFNCSLLSELSRFHLLKEQMNVSVNGRLFKDSEVVFVTYASSDHAGELRLSIEWMRKQGLKNKIILYDIGLAFYEKEEFRSVCNVELRPFNFSAYPAFVGNLQNYHFKALIIAEVFVELDAFWAFDSSVRFNNSAAMARFYDDVRQLKIESYVIRMPARHSIYASTDPGMYAYFPIDRKLYKSMEMFESGSTFVWKTQFSRDAIKWFVLCTLTEDCLTPPDSKWRCYFDRGRWDIYLDCHRYDQSAINLILNNLLEGILGKRAIKAPSYGFVEIKRWKSSYKPLQLPCKTDNGKNN